MKSAALHVFGWILFCVVGFAAEEVDPRIKAEAIVDAANHWREGDAIRTELLSYANSWVSDIQVNPLGTDMLIARIKNYNLIKNIALRTNIDARIPKAAIHHALGMVGPTKFLTEVRSNLTAPVRLKKQALVKHVAGESLFVHFADLPEEPAQKVLREISDELRLGKPFTEALIRYQRKYPAVGGRTKIGTGVEFLLAENKDPVFSYPTWLIPKEHADALVAARSGEILIMPFKEDPNQVDVVGDGRGLMLYQIHEVYLPFQGL